MTDLAVPDETPADVAAAAPLSPLVAWAFEARQAQQIAISLAKTSFVPASLRGKPDDITAAILAGQELGLQPMATLRSLDVIQGTPALRAHAMRGLVQSHGHDVELVESDATHCVMRGRRRAGMIAGQWQEVTWTIDRARQLGLADKDQWRKQPQTMLVARATGELCRLIAADVLHAMPYAAEEIDHVEEPAAPAAPRVTVAEITGTAPEPKFTDETDGHSTDPNPAFPVQDPPVPEDEWPPTPQPPDAKPRQTRRTVLERQAREAASDDEN